MAIKDVVSNVSIEDQIKAKIANNKAGAGIAPVINPAKTGSVPEEEHPLPTPDLPMVDIEPSKPVIPLTPLEPSIPDIIVPDIPTLQQTLFKIVDDYIEAMSPKKHVSPEHGGMWQTKLYRVMMRILQAQPVEFFPMWTRLLDTVNEHRKSTGVFNDRYALRFMYCAPINTTERKCFERLMGLLMEMANPRHRVRMAAHLDVGYFTQYLISQDAVMNIQNYNMTIADM